MATARQFAEAGHVATPAGQTRDGQPADVAHMIVFLARDEPKHINGAEIVIKNSVTARQGIAP